MFFDTIFAHGTFKTSPQLFTQALIIRAIIESSNLPILYALLEDKRSASYTSVLEFIHSRCPLLKPLTTICDFEKAEHSAASLVFQDSAIRGCMFHFNQAQMRRFQKIPDSTSDGVLRVLLSSVYGLPFLPIGDVLHAWTELKTRIGILYPVPAIIRCVFINWLVIVGYSRLG